MRCILPKILFGDEIKTNEVGGAYRAYTGFWWGNVRQEVTWKTELMGG
jgi:hypothetical protein